MFLEGGSWPSLEYTKCNAYSGDPIIRNLKLKSALMVCPVNLMFLLFYLSFTL